MVEYVADRDPFAGDPEEDVESDCEKVSSEVASELLETRGEQELLPRAVLTTGSFSACVFSRILSFRRVEKGDKFHSWKSLFFYRCTDEISFAPLRSDGTNSRSDYVRKRTTAEAPPPCSPKSIYLLAKLVRVSLIESCSW